jgi:hypothetical protein
MKNLYLISTNRPSRLVLDTVNENLFLTTTENFGTDIMKFQNIYIIHNEEIKERDWIFNEEREPSVLQCIGKGSLRGWKKIILTTDPQLIDDGVQAIDDEFLNWFVKNPSCEEVKFYKDLFQVNQNNPVLKGSTALVESYKIIIPEELKPHSFELIGECKGNDGNGCFMDSPGHDCGCFVRKPKQEPLEEVKLRQIFKNLSDCYADTGSFENDSSYREGEVIQAMTEDTFIKIINEWQQEQQDNFIIGFLEFIEGTYSYSNIFDHWYLHASTSKTYTKKELLKVYRKFKKKQHE